MTKNEITTEFRGEYPLQYKSYNARARTHTYTRTRARTYARTHTHTHFLCQTFHRTKQLFWVESVLCVVVETVRYRFAKKKKKNQETGLSWSWNLFFRCKVLVKFPIASALICCTRTPLLRHFSLFFLFFFLKGEGGGAFFFRIFPLADYFAALCEVEKRGENRRWKLCL